MKGHGVVHCVGGQCENTAVSALLIPESISFPLLVVWNTPTWSAGVFLPPQC